MKQKACVTYRGEEVIVGWDGRQTAQQQQAPTWQIHPGEKSRNPIIDYKCQRNCDRVMYSHICWISVGSRPHSWSQLCVPLPLVGLFQLNTESCCLYHLNLDNPATKLFNVCSQQIFQSGEIFLEAGCVGEVRTKLQYAYITCMHLVVNDPTNLKPLSSSQLPTHLKQNV